MYKYVILGVASGWADSAIPGTETLVATKSGDVV